MLLTAQLRWLRHETRMANGGTEIATALTLQQWSDPDPLKGEVAGAWQDVPTVEGEAVAAVKQ